MSIDFITDYDPGQLTRDEWRAVLAAYVALLKSDNPEYRGGRGGLDNAMHKIRLNLVPTDYIETQEIKENA